MDSYTKSAYLFQYALSSASTLTAISFQELDSDRKSLWNPRELRENIETTRIAFLSLAAGWNFLHDSKFDQLDEELKAEALSLRFSIDTMLLSVEVFDVFSRQNLEADFINRSQEVLKKLADREIGYNRLTEDERTYVQDTLVPFLEALTHSIELAPSDGCF